MRESPHVVPPSAPGACISALVAAALLALAGCGRSLPVEAELLLESSSLEDVPAALTPVSVASLATGDSTSLHVLGDARRDSLVVLRTRDDGQPSVRVFGKQDVTDAAPCDDCRGHGFGRSVAAVDGWIVVGGGRRRESPTSLRHKGGVWVFAIDEDRVELSDAWSADDFRRALGFGVGLFEPQLSALDGADGEPGHVFIGLARTGHGVVVQARVHDGRLDVTGVLSAGDLGLSRCTRVGEFVSAGRHGDGRVGLCVRAHDEDDRPVTAYVVLSSQGVESSRFLPAPDATHVLGGMCRVRDLTGDGVDDVVLGSWEYGPRHVRGWGADHDAFVSLYDVAGARPRLVRTVSYESFLDERGRPLRVPSGAPRVARDADERHLLVSASDRSTGHGAVWRVDLEALE